MRTFIFALIAGSLPLGAYATNSFSGSHATEPLTRYTATIEQATYSGSIFLFDGTDRFEVALGTPSSIKSKGLPLSALAPGKIVTVDAFDSKSDASDTLYARRIVVDGRIFDLR
jgi:hypothetical protein